MRHIVTTHTKLLGEIKIAATTKGTYKAASYIPYYRIVNLLETNDLNEETGYLALAINHVLSNSTLVKVVNKTKLD